MSPPAKRKRTRKATKEKDSLSRQTSLWDAFGLKSSSSQKNTPTASAATSENESVAADDIIDICSSDAEPVESEPLNAVPASSSPYPADAEGSTSATLLPDSGSKDIPIIIIDSSPTASPVPPRKALPRAPPKPLYSIFAPRKRPDDRSVSQKPSNRASAGSSAPFPDSITQHVRGQQQTFNAPPHQFPSRLAPSGSSTTSEPFDYSRFVQGSSHDKADDAVAHPVRGTTPLNIAARDGYISRIPLSHRSYPAISRLLEEQPSVNTSDPSSSCSLLWNDKWRPRRAEQVLGNERSALYLRDWLLALKLHITASEDAPTPSPATSDNKGKQKAGKPPKGKAKGPRGLKRPRVVRDVQKKRRRVDSEDPDDSWIADDSSEDEAPLDVVLESEGDFIPTKLSRLKRAETEESLGELPSSQLEDPPPAPADDPPSDDSTPPFSYTPPKFGDTIYNTILLSGPHGCGKTAAVYACAEELGWDVFEVYPGIGERSGAALNRLIGEVGKNHLVKQTQYQPKAEGAEEPPRPLRSKANFFAKRVVSDDEDEGVSNLSASQEAVPERQEPTEVKPEAPAIVPVVSQSIVLVEEVDVLYKEDTNFWPTLLKIIRECRRPVVLTCNDTSLVPIGDLPLQTTLYFDPCPTPLATSYLQALCLAENRIVDRDAIERLYVGLSARVEADDGDMTLHPELIPMCAPDLRRTINQLQSGAVSRAGPEADALAQRVSQEEVQSTQHLIRMARCIELSSFVDSGLRRPGEEVLRDLLSNSASPCADDQLGYKHLVATPHDADSALPITFSTYHYDEVILSTLLSSAQSFYPAPSDLHLASAPDPPHPLHAAYCGTMLPILDRLRVPRDQLVRDAHGIFLDYEPWVRFMSRVDDARIAGTVASGRLEGARRTRNSQRSQWELIRWIMLNEEELDVLRQTEFQLDDE
ncbi:hypothetical protein OH77DRAFT_240046 [Trametes cingulata]|nr:hypothetical protein OH77DRAFT_240046 [Trametes cingulata]